MKPIHLLLGAGALILGYKAIKKKPATNPVAAVVAAAGPVSRFPSWQSDRVQIMAKAQKVWAERGGARSTSAWDQFLVTSDTLEGLWPKLPWPQDLEDQTPVPTPGAPGVFEQRWVVAAGSVGNAMKAVWDPTSDYVDGLMTGSSFH